MKAEFEKGAMGMLSALSFGSIYPRLKHLEHEGLIETQQVSADGRHKKIYELTAEGWRELMRWLGQSSVYPIPLHDELLLKIVFWGATGSDRGALIDQLRERRTASQDLLHYIDAWQNNGISFVDEYGEIVLSYIQMHLEAELRWIEKTIAQLEGPAQLPAQDPRWLAVLQKARRSAALKLSADDEESPAEQVHEEL
jgi:DNA-binding PadR family transcriptional regulator